MYRLALLVQNLLWLVGNSGLTVRLKTSSGARGARLKGHRVKVQESAAKLYYASYTHSCYKPPYSLATLFPTRAVVTCYS